jgi:hypothetical protein
MPASRRSVSRAPRPHGRTPASLSAPPETLGLLGGQGDLVAVFTGVAGTGDEIVTDAGGKKRFQGFAGGTAFRQHLPDALAGVRSLDGNHRQRMGTLATRRDADRQLPVVEAGTHPGQILIGSTGIDDDAVTAVVEVVDDQVVDDAAAFVEHGAVQGLAGNLQLVDVVGEQTPQESTGISALDIDGAHVRDIEHAGVTADGVVFLDLRTVVERHLPAAKIDHSCAAAAVAFVKDSFLHHCQSS